VKLLPVRALLGGLTGLALLSGQVFAASPSWVSYNAKAHAVTLTIIAGYKGGFDFNGDSHGKMIVTIPLGTKVTVKFSNNASSLPHSVMVTTWADRMAASNFAMPFKGAASPNPTTGSGKGHTYTFTFTANKAGTYALVCAVPGHAAAGMWDTLKVVKGGSASVKL
jgi:sulfocyanin